MTIQECFVILFVRKFLLVGLSQSMAGGSEGYLPPFLAALVLIVSRDPGGRKELGSLHLSAED